VSEVTMLIFLDFLVVYFSIFFSGDLLALFLLLPFYVFYLLADFFSLDYPFLPLAGFFSLPGETDFFLPFLPYPPSSSQTSFKSLFVSFYSRALFLFSSALSNSGSAIFNSRHSAVLSNTLMSWTLTAG
jgi:hypothetical protein